MTMTSLWLLVLCLPVVGFSQTALPAQRESERAGLVLSQSQGADNRVLRLDSFFYETAQGRITLPAQLTSKGQDSLRDGLEAQTKTMDGRTVTLSEKRDGHNFIIRLS